MCSSAYSRWPSRLHELFRIVFQSCCFSTLRDVQRDRFSVDGETAVSCWQDIQRSRGSAMATTRSMLLASALLLCCSIVDALSHDAGMIAPRRCIAPRVRAPLTVMGKSKKQDDLAAMMAAAQAQREGRPVDFDLPEPKPKPNRQKLQPKTTTKAVKSRADMLNLMKSAQASATGLGSGLADAGKEKRSAAEMRGAPRPNGLPASRAPSTTRGGLLSLSRAAQRRGQEQPQQRHPFGRAAATRHAAAAAAQPLRPGRGAEWIRLTRGARGRRVLPRPPRFE